MDTFTLTQVHFLRKKRYFYFKKTLLLLLYWATLLSLLYLNAIQVKTSSIYSKRTSTFLWSMSDAHLQMIHSFVLIMFKGLIKPVGELANWFTNQFEWFVQFPAVIYISK